MSITHDMIIIGAGMTGLLSAYFTKPFSQSLILEKSRGVGGRLANRRFENNAFDTGAQFMRARSEGFQAFTSTFAEQSILKLWKNDEDSNPLYWGNEKMTQLPKALSKNLNIEFKKELEHIGYHQTHWSLTTTTGETYHCRQLIFTSPLPQTLKILKRSEIELENLPFQKMSSIEYRVTLALLAKTSSSYSQSDIIVEYPDHPNLERSINQSEKGIAQDHNCITFHFKHEFSKIWIEQPEKDATEKMKSEIESIGFELETYQYKKWRYADPFTTYGELFYQDPNYSGLYLAGDSFGGGSVEGTWRSAKALSEHLQQCHH